MNKLKGNEHVYIEEIVSTVLQKTMPIKQKDPGMFTISCKISNVGIEQAMCDLGASINLMPYMPACFLLNTDLVFIHLHI